MRATMRTRTDRTTREIQSIEDQSMTAMAALLCRRETRTISARERFQQIPRVSLDTEPSTVSYRVVGCIVKERPPPRVAASFIRQASEQRKQLRRLIPHCHNECPTFLRLYKKPPPRRGDLIYP